MLSLVRKITASSSHLRTMLPDRATGSCLPKGPITQVSTYMTRNACTGISSQIRTKLRDWAIWPALAGCHSWAALSSNDSKTLYLGGSWTWDAVWVGGVGQREGKGGSLPLPKWAPPLSLVRKREGGEAGKFASPLPPLLRLVLMGAIFRGQQSH